MKDPNDKATLDLIDKPRRGRPVTGKAKTQAQIQRDYRARQKLMLANDRVFTIQLTDRDLSSIVSGLDREHKGLKAIGHCTAPTVDVLREHLRALLQGKIENKKTSTPALLLYQDKIRNPPLT